MPILSVLHYQSNDHQSQEDVQEDWGWKLVHGEVFRTPRFPLALSVMVGNGAQICAMVSVTLSSCSPSIAEYLFIEICAYSLCVVGLPLPLKSRFTCHGNDDLLDILWRVKFMPLSLSVHALTFVQNRRLRVESRVCVAWWYKQKEKCLHDGDSVAYVRSNVTSP